MIRKATVALFLVMMFTNIVLAGQIGDGLSYYGNPEMTSAYAYYSNTGHELFIEVILTHNNSWIDIDSDQAWDYAYAQTSYYQYDHEECDRESYGEILQ